MAPSAEREGVKIPLLEITINAPDRATVTWYVGLGAMTALEVIDWPVALIVAASHTLATHARHPEVRELVEGIEAGF